MRTRSTIIVSIVALGAVAVSGYAFVQIRNCAHDHMTASAAGTTTNESCASGGAAAGAAANESCAPKATAAGRFDPVMSGVCRYSCATQKPYEPSQVMSQPGATAGHLTRCPVSGVVFAVDAGRPHVALASGEYVFCCDRCAEKFRKDPGHFVNL